MYSTLMSFLSRESSEECTGLDSGVYTMVSVEIVFSCMGANYIFTQEINTRHCIMLSCSFHEIHANSANESTRQSFQKIFYAF